MRIGTLAESWEKYTTMVSSPPVGPPPESIFVWDGDSLVAGCCIYPCADSGLMFVTRTIGSEAGLLFLLQVLRGHSTVTSRSPVIEFAGDATWPMPIALLKMYTLADEEAAAAEPPPSKPDAPPDDDKGFVPDATARAKRKRSKK